MHPDRDTMLGMVREAGFEDAEARRLFFGIVAIHDGARP
jgi:ubiquinone/menaquinone biosynthesis C-methylase UbiE